MSADNGGHCSNTNGSFECSCQSGYVGNGIKPGITLGNEKGSGCGKSDAERSASFC